MKSPASPRVLALSKLSEALSDLMHEWQIDALLIEALAPIFTPTRAIEIYVSPDGHDEQLCTSEGRRIAPLIETMFGEDGSTLLEMHDALRNPTLFEGDDGPSMLAPMIVRGTLLGVVAVHRGKEAPHFTLSDLETLCSVAGLAALALHHARRHITMRRIAIAEDLQRARSVQRRFLPTLPPVVGKLAISSAYRPALDVSGDFYDLVLEGDDRAMVVIGDVSGHGVSAALVMARVSSEFRRVARYGRTPAQVLRELARTVEQGASDETFVTAACMQIEIAEGMVTLASAGHVPVIVRRANGTTELRGNDGGVPLGMPSAEGWHEERFEFSSGDLILLATDGAVEALATADATPTGIDELAAIVSRAPAHVDAVTRAVLAAVDAVARLRGADDVTLLALALS